MQNLLNNNENNNNVNNNAAEQVTNNNAAAWSLYDETISRARSNKSAAQQVTYVTIKKAVAFLNECIKKDDLESAVLRDELAAVGYSAFSLSLVDMSENKTAMVGGYKTIKNDETGETKKVNAIIYARIDEAGRPCYRPADLVKAFETKFADTLKAYRDKVAADKKAADKARRDEIAKAKKAYNDAKRAAEKAAKKAAESELAQYNAKAAERALKAAEKHYLSLVG